MIATKRDDEMYVSCFHIDLGTVRITVERGTKSHSSVVAHGSHAMFVMYLLKFPSTLPLVQIRAVHQSGDLTILRSTLLPKVESRRHM